MANSIEDTKLKVLQWHSQFALYHHSDEVIEQLSGEISAFAEEETPENFVVAIIYSLLISSTLAEMTHLSPEDLRDLVFIPASMNAMAKEHGS